MFCRTKVDFGSDYKDDGTNILLDANENAYGPGLALNGEGKLANGTSDSSASIDVDLLGLNRYPDPYVRLTLLKASSSQLTMYAATKRTSSSSYATSATLTPTRRRTSAQSTSS